jgi:hypothetical protein
VLVLLNSSECEDTRIPSLQTWQPGSAPRGLPTSWWQMPAQCILHCFNDRYGSLGNHDVLGGIQGVDDQIAYTHENPEWYLPARYFAKRIGHGKTAINLVVADTSSFIDGVFEDLMCRPSRTWLASDQRCQYAV